MVLISTGDPASVEPRARKILLSRFVEKTDEEVSLLEVRDELCENGVFVEITWTNDYIKQFLAKVFNGIEITPPLQRRLGSKRVKRVYPYLGQFLVRFYK